MLDRRCFAGAALLFVCGCTATSSNAPSAVQVTSAVTTKVQGYAIWNASCAMSQMPVVTITQAPKNGQLEAKQTTNRVANSNFGSNPCLGRDVEGVGLYYTSNAGFHGLDHVQYTVYYPGSGAVSGHTTENSMDISVK